LVLVSAVMTSYNHEKYISASIESVLNQSFKDFELIVLDDCSKDNSQKIIETYQAKDVRIQALFHKKNTGMAKSMNDLFAVAKGKYIALIDSDDLWEKTKLEKQLAILEKNDSQIVWSEGKIIDSEGLPIGETFTQNEQAQHKKKSGNLFEILLNRNFIFDSSVIFKKELAEGIRFNEELKYYNAYKFLVDLAKNHSFLFIPEPLARYRVHGMNAHLSDEKGWKSDEIVFGNLILQEYGNYISNKTRAKWFLTIGISFSYFGNKDASRRNILEAIGLNPFNKENFKVLILALINGEDYIAKLFTKFRSGYLRFAFVQKNRENKQF
jgi:teichuronic acid biosynthesis glycosyltransferase TuaG